MNYNHKKIDKKWQDYWIKNKTFYAKENSDQKKLYLLNMFPYPSGEGLHVGHGAGYIACDIICRQKKMLGFNVLNPMGFDSFGLPAEQYAIQTGQNPAITTKENIQNYKRQLKSIGLVYDWEREITTSDPCYYKWTQFIFTLLFESWYDEKENKAKKIDSLLEIFEKEGNINIENFYENKFSADDWKNFSEKEKLKILENYRLAYKKESEVNWCEGLKTVLSNDEVKDGKSERGGYEVTKKKMNQWMLRITVYAERLLEGLQDLDWSDSVKNIQKNWIGKSAGFIINFEIFGKNEKLKIFTTRPETIFGVTYIGISIDHDFIKNIKEERILKDILEIKNKKEETIQGVNSGFFVLHPFTGKLIPIWIVNYVFSDYATASIMGVPSLDQRDEVFANKFSIGSIKVIEDEKMINSDFLDGENLKDAKNKIEKVLIEKKLGYKKNYYKIRDAVFGRQRYWGEPIPIYEKDGNYFCLDEKDLALSLPLIENYLPTDDGKSPLSRVDNWKYGNFELESDTMPSWAASSWYFFRYIDSQNDENFCDIEKQKYWENVDLYIGGIEHASGHLIYARFWTKFLYDIGYSFFEEPFKKLINQGMILGKSAFIFRIKDTNDFVSFDLKDKYSTTQVRIPINLIEDNFVFVEKLKRWRNDFENSNFIKNENGEFLCQREVEKMSKSKFNVVNPDQIIEKYGSDTLRLYTMFLGPLEVSKPWDENGILGVYKFLKRVFNLFVDEDDQIILEKKDPNILEQKILQKTINKVNNAIESFSFNTAVSSFMIFVNEIYQINSKNYCCLINFLKILAPFAPHICEEIWSKLGNENSIFFEKQPLFDASVLEEEYFTYPISINGKTRGKVSLKIDVGEEEIENILMQNSQIKKWLDEKKIKKMILIKNKIINIVI
jgi:leucyl-tRNA synthetase